jgi:hypothetical protein
MHRPKLPNADPPRASASVNRVESDGLAAAAAIAAASFSAVIDTHRPNLFVFARLVEVPSVFGAADGSTA